MENENKSSEKDEQAKKNSNRKFMKGDLVSVNLAKRKATGKPFSYIYCSKAFQILSLKSK